MWEIHSDPDKIATVNCESDVGNQPGDSRTRERRKPVVTIQPEVEGTERQEPVVGNKEDPGESERGTGQPVVTVDAGGRF